MQKNAPPEISRPDGFYRNLTINNTSLTASALIVNLETGHIIDINKSCLDIIGYSYDEVVGGALLEFGFLEGHEDWAGFVEMLHKDGGISEAQIRLRRKDGQLVNLRWAAELIALNPQEVLLSERADRSECQGIGKAEGNMQQDTQNLKEAYTALKIVLKRLTQRRAEIEERVFSNIRELILPLIGSLKHTDLSAEQMGLVRAIENNLNEINNAFMTHLKLRYSALTPREIEIATLVRESKSTKEMALLLNITPKTVEFHRSRLRQKLGLRDKKINLQSYLKTMEQ
ncbi:MAG: hypothetical protein CSYNP_00489 [Syntrophus sp. SKADARSKE-3]|nr:hypothetical protein [Syntrophus sp. SKADARSKE-3]